jgi:hypothetical protein
MALVLILDGLDPELFLYLALRTQRYVNNVRAIKLVQGPTQETGSHIELQ